VRCEAVKYLKLGDNIFVGGDRFECDMADLDGKTDRVRILEHVAPAEVEPKPIDSVGPPVRVRIPLGIGRRIPGVTMPAVGDIPEQPPPPDEGPTFLVGNQIVGPGYQATFGECEAVELIAGRRVELAPGSELTAKGERFLAALLGWPAAAQATGCRRPQYTDFA
jgi:hypothetical protein